MFPFLDQAFKVRNFLSTEFYDSMAHQFNHPNIIIKIENMTMQVLANYDLPCIFQSLNCF